MIHGDQCRESGHASYLKMWFPGIRLPDVFSRRELLLHTMLATTLSNVNIQQTNYFRFVLAIVDSNSKERYENLIYDVT